MTGVSKETDSGEVSYRTVEEVASLLSPGRPLLEGLSVIQVSSCQTLETLFRRPRHRKSGITTLSRAA